MKVFIVGAGALGILFGSYLHRNAVHIVYLTRTRKQAEQMNQSGCKLSQQQGETFLFYPQAVTMENKYDMRLMQDIDLVLISLKQPQLITVLPWLKEHVNPHTPLLCVMNGLGHLELIQQYLSNPLYAGVTSSGATRLSTLEVLERGRGVTKVGKILNIDTASSSDQIIKVFLNHLRKQQLQVMWSNEIEIEMWKKCIINACINPLTAIFQVKNGMLIKDKHLHTLMLQLYTEISTLIKQIKGNTAQKILNHGRLWQEIEEICRITSENVSSMLQDVQNNRQTEIEAITGFFLREAKKYNFSLAKHNFVYHALQFVAQKRTDRGETH